MIRVWADRLDVMATVMMLCLKACHEHPEADFTFGPQDPLQAFRSGFWLDGAPKEVEEAILKVPGVTL